jgi:hypothetical protein
MPVPWPGRQDGGDAEVVYGVAHSGDIRPEQDDVAIALYGAKEGEIVIRMA